MYWVSQIFYLIFALINSQVWIFCFHSIVHYSNTFNLLPNKGSLLYTFFHGNVKLHFGPFELISWVLESSSTMIRVGMSYRIMEWVNFLLKMLCSSSEPLVDGFNAQYMGGKKNWQNQHGWRLCGSPGAGSTTGPLCCSCLLVLWAYFELLHNLYRIF